MNKLARSKLVLLAVIYFGANLSVFAQEWSPSKTVKIIVPIVGSTNDVLARIVAPKLSEAIGQPVVVENKPGAGGNIGADFVAKSSPDGHTLLVGYNGPLAINVGLFDKMPYDPVKDLAPITLAVATPQYLVVNPALPIKTVPEFVAYAKNNAHKMSYASIAVGSASHLTMEMLKVAAAVDLTHIPYRGAGPAVTDLIAGNVDAAFLVPGNVQQFLKEGRLRLIATSGQKRFASTPTIPTLIESGYPDFVVTGWLGFFVRSQTPPDIVKKLNAATRAAVNTEEFRSRIEGEGLTVAIGNPQDLTRQIKTDEERWGKVVNQAKITI